MYKSILKDLEIAINIKNGEISLNGNSFDWDCIRINDHLYQIIKNNKTYLVQVISFDLKSKIFQVKVNGKTTSIRIKDKVELLLEKLGMQEMGQSVINDLEAPMPGLILDILVNEKQKVKKDAPLLILEAMKMENIIKSPINGVVKSIKVKKGQNVEKNQILIQF